MSNISSCVRRGSSGLFSALLKISMFRGCISRGLLLSGLVGVTSGATQAQQPVVGNRSPVGLQQWSPDRTPDNDERGDNFAYVRRPSESPAFSRDGATNSISSSSGATYYVATTGN